MLMNNVNVMVDINVRVILIILQI